MHRCVIGLGSNFQRKEMMALARLLLTEAFPSVRFTTEQETLPLNFHNQALFSNQIGVFMTDAEEDEVICCLKAMEKKAGRCPEDKIHEKICLDIDLLLFDQRVVKPDDLKREYVIKGLEELNRMTL